MTQRIGIFGGTFDPVHLGHINAAQQLVEELNLTTLAMVPAFQPVHKNQPHVTSQQRLSMLSLACHGEELIHCDAREIKRGGPSYTLITLQEYRAEHPDACLYFLMGIDAFATFNSWYHWQEFLDFCNLIILARPGELPNLSDELSTLLNTYEVEDIHAIKTSESGLIYRSQRAMLQFSSTEVRQCMAKPDDIFQMLPEKVLNYIHDHKLYGQHLLN